LSFSEYNQEPVNHIDITSSDKIASFITKNNSNIDLKTVNSFSEEWLKFNNFSEEEITNAGKQYFDIIDESIMNKNSLVLDIGCGSGRWTKYIAPKVKFIEALDPSRSVLTAYQLNKNEKNVRITQAEISNIPFNDNTFDFVVCLGVLHHIPDTQQALIDIVKKLKRGGSILLYLYYNMDNRGFFFKFLFRISHLFRLIISRFPKILKKIICDIIACFVYIPIVSLVRLLILLPGENNWIKKIPLSYYADKSLNIIRNDALDRFGTPLEQRFSKKQITEMMNQAGLESILFSKNEPYWHAVGIKK